MGLTSRKKPTYAERMNEHTVVAPTVQTVTIPVADQDRALEFYRDVLGFEVRQDVAFGDNRWVSVAPPGGPVDFTLHPPFPGQEPGWQQGIVLRTDDIVGLIERLRSSGVDVEDAEQVPWGLQATFADPDRNGFVLLQPGG